MIRRCPFAIRFTRIATMSLVVCLAIQSSVAAERSAGCGKPAPSLPGESMELAYTSGGLERTYRLHLPEGYHNDQAIPLVLSIHGYTGSALFSDQTWSGMSAYADKEGYVVVYPQSTSYETGPPGEQSTVTSWNDQSCSAKTGASREGPEGPLCALDASPYPCPPECGECSPCNWCSCYDDVGAIEALLDELESTLCIDLNRVFAVGYSNGGMFTQRLGCALESRFAGIVPLHGTLARGFNCSPSKDGPSLFLMGGTVDRTVPMDGTRSSDGYYYTSMRDVAAAWASALSCSSVPTRLETEWATDENELACLEHRNCVNGRRVLNCSWKGAHDWPKSGGIAFGNELLWQFFESTSKSQESSAP